MSIPRRWLPGDRLSTARLAAERAEILANRDLKVDTRTGLELVKYPWGQLLRRTRPEVIDGTLSGAGPAYTFVEAEDSGGTWSAGPIAGTAYEVNGVTGLAGSRQELHPDRLGTWRFQSIRPGSGGGGGGTGNIPNCFCTAIPAVLTMTSADESCNFRMFQSCTISYGPHPGFEALSFGTNYYLSDEGFPDPVADNAIFYYALLCQFNQFSLTRAYLTSPYGSPFRDGILYTWLVGGYGNTCDPFHLDNGTAFPGSDPSCVVQIDG